MRTISFDALQWNTFSYNALRSSEQKSLEAWIIIKVTSPHGSHTPRFWYFNYRCHHDISRPGSLDYSMKLIVPQLMTLLVQNRPICVFFTHFSILALLLSSASEKARTLPHCHPHNALHGRKSLANILIGQTDESCNMREIKFQNRQATLCHTLILTLAGVLERIQLQDAYTGRIEKCPIQAHRKSTIWQCRRSCGNCKPF